MGARNFSTVPVAELGHRGLIPDTTPPLPLVLVVDDEATIVDTLVLIFKQAGFAAIPAYDAAEALEIARVTPPDVLLTDVVMPGMNGIELATAMKELVPDCLTVLFSGQADELEFLLGLHVNAAQFTTLAKPLPPRDLLAEITRLLEPTRKEQSPMSPRPPTSDHRSRARVAEVRTGTGGH